MQAADSSTDTAISSFASSYSCNYDCGDLTFSLTFSPLTSAAEETLAGLIYFETSDVPLTGNDKKYVTVFVKSTDDYTIVDTSVVVSLTGW